MKTQTWLRVFSITFLIQVLIITTTSISIHSIKDKIQDDDNLIENESQIISVDKKETVGEARWMSSYIFPLFPQFYNLDYNSVWNFLKRSDTIGYFVVRDIISYIGLMSFWVILGTILWDGEKGDDSEFDFPLSLVAKLFMPTSEIDSKEALSKEYFEGANYKEGTAAVDRLDPDRNPGSFLSQISINGLYNFLTRPSTAAGNLFLSAGFSTFGMLIWFLPTFLYTGEDLDETDRPFAPFFGGSNFAAEKSALIKRRKGDENDLRVEDRLSSIYSAITVESSFAKVYNRLFCPQCVARLAVISAVGLTGKMIFWTFVSLLPREDFDPWYFRPFENFWKTRGFIGGLGPLSSLQREPEGTTEASSRYQTEFDSPRSNDNYQTSFGTKRSFENPLVVFVKNFFSDLLINVEESIELVNKGAL